MDNDGDGGLIAAVQLSDRSESEQPEPLYISKDDLSLLTWRDFSTLVSFFIVFIKIGHEIPKSTIKLKPKTKRKF